MKTIYNTRILSVFLFLYISNKTISQTPALRFEHIGMEQGLSSNTAFNIMQDSKGFIWIGTPDGLNKYDGYSFIKYKFDPLDSNSLSQNLVYTTWEDKDGFIWVSTYEGLCKFDRTTEKFTRYKPDPRSKFSDPNILSINEDKNGIMWLGGASGQLCRFDKYTGKFYDESFDLGFRMQPGELLHDGINCIFKDKEGSLWVGNYTGLHKVNVQPGKTPLITHYFHDPQNPNTLSSKSVFNVFEDHAGILWIVTDNGLNSFNKTTNKFTYYPPDHNKITSSASDIGAVPPSGALSEDHEGSLWIGTIKGLARLNKDRTAVTMYTHRVEDPNSLNADIVSCIFIDRTGILWVGSVEKGLNKANLFQKSFGLRQHDPGNIHSLSNDNVTAIVEDNSGAVWIGTDGGGLDRWDKKTDQFTRYVHDPNDPGTLRYDYVYAILNDRQGDLWVCNGDMLSRFNKETGKFIHYNSNAANYKDVDFLSIYSITEDRDGLIWLGTGNGIKSFDKKAGRFTHYYHDPGNAVGISDYTAQTIFADSKNNIWVGYGSIATDRLDKKTGIITHYKHDPRDAASISSNIVNGFYQDSKGNLWLATTAGGLCRFDYATGKFSTYTVQHGLPDNTIYSILEDDKNDLWLSTHNGLSRFDPVKKTFTNYDYSDGLQGNQFAAGQRQRPSSCKSHDGSLYFGGDKGFNFFNPSLIKTNTQLPLVVITQFKLFDKLVKGANEAKEIILGHDENYFAFEFASLSFYNEDKNQYAYKLEGVDKDWVYSGSRRYAGYTDVGPGKYTFRVKATNNDGVWNEEGVSLLVTIRSPWWRTWWAYGVYVLFLVAAIMAIHRYQKQKVVEAERARTQKKELAQAKEIEKAYHQLKETQAQLIQSEKMASLGELTAGIAHEIQNPLNFVNNFSDVSNELIEELKIKNEKLKIEDDEVKNLLDDISQNLEKINHHGRRADAIVKGMLQHSRTSSGQKEPTDINALCDEYLRLAYHGLRAKDKSFNAEIKTDFDSNIRKVNVFPQDIGRVLLNLINNAYYAVSEKAKLQAINLPAGKAGYEPSVFMSTKRKENVIEIKIKDNGNGIPQNIIDKIFQPFFTTKPTGEGTGLGLSLAYDIIKAHGGEIKVGTREGEGSEFIILMPVNQ